MLMLTGSELAPTDTADHALEVLARSNVREVIIAGRRGPAQAAFTNPELRELGDLSDADVFVDPAELDRALAVADTKAEENVTARQNVQILRDYSRRAPMGRRRQLRLRFLLSPVELIADEQGRVAAIAMVHNELVGEPDGALRARSTDQLETIAAGLVFRAIGYRGVPLPGVPFDERRGVIPNEGGRVTDPGSGAVLPGEYVVGWIKRGPTGVIGTNKKDAQETVDAIKADLSSSGDGHAPALAPTAPDPDAVRELFEARQPDLVTYDGWLEIDRHERARGEPEGRPRVKLTRIDEMLRVAASESPHNPTEEHLDEVKAR
jgi:ferredoxin--NADP+ reductase